MFTPLQISFVYMKMYVEQTSLSTVESIIDGFFFLDIIVGFNTSYIDHRSGDEIFSFKSIAREYMIEGDFIIDFVSTINVVGYVGVLLQIDIVGGMKVLEDSLKVLKVLRFRKLLQKIREINRTVQEKALYQVAFWIAAIFIYTHFTACFLWYSFRTDKIFVPAVDFGAVSAKLHLEKPDLNENGLKDDTFWYQYFTMYYNSAISFALVEVNARTSQQVPLMFMIYLMNALFNAYIFGIFIDLIGILSQK